MTCERAREHEASLGAAVEHSVEWRRLRGRLATPRSDCATCGRESRRHRQRPEPMPHCPEAENTLEVAAQTLSSASTSPGNDLQAGQFMDLTLITLETDAEARAAYQSTAHRTIRADIHHAPARYRLQALAADDAAWG